MSSDEPLPLDDPRWVPLESPHKLRTQRTGDRHLAAEDLTKLLATPPPLGVRSMRRYSGHYRDPDRPDLERELPPFAFWTEHALSSWSDGLFIRPARQHTVVRAVGFYAWKPDLEQIWPDMFPPSTVAPSPGPGSADFWIDEVFPDDAWRQYRPTQVYDGIVKEIEKRNKEAKTRNPDALPIIAPSLTAVRDALKNRPQN
jgi:hypothetical protein